MESFSKVFEGASLKDAIEVVGPKAHEARRADFKTFCEVGLIICFKMLDTKEVWTIEFDSKRYSFERGEAVDFPLVTIEGKAANWPIIRAHLLELADLLEGQKERAKGRKWTRALHDAFESFDGSIDLSFVDDTYPHPVDIRIILNNYEDSGFDKFSATIPVALLFDVARGQVSPRSAAKTLKIGGSLGFAIELGGFFATHFEKT